MIKINEIYKITNKVNNKIYIGITIQGFKTRFGHHLYEAKTDSPFPIHKAIRKYGESSFEIEVLEIVESIEELKEREKFYIKELKAKDRKFGYNLTEGGDGTFGRMHSNETKAKIGEKAKGRVVSEETKQKMRDAQNRIKNEPWYKENKRRAAYASHEAQKIRIIKE